MRKIIVGVDPSESAQRAFEWALNNAHPEDTVVVVHAWQIHAVAAMDIPEAYNEVDFDLDARRFLKDFVAEALELVIDDGRGPTVTTNVVRGHPGRALIDLSDDADLLVVGSRGFGGFRGLLLGSVSTYVVHHAKCPVVVVPAGDPEPEDANAG